MIIDVDINVDCILQVPVLAAHNFFPTAMGVVRLEAAREHVQKVSVLAANALLIPTAMGLVWDEDAWEHVFLFLIQDR